MPLLTWIGKQASDLASRRTPICALEPRDPKQVGSPADGNLLIQGDNLVAMKSLLPFYEQAFKMVYMDPPYNTGNQTWVYNDSMKAPQTQEWLNKVVGPEDQARSDKWLCMMQPRIEAAYDLLREDGILAVSIDHYELHNLVAILDLQFGSSNRLGILSIVNNAAGRSDSDFFATSHEYLVVYAREKALAQVHGFPLSDDDIKRYKHEDDKGRYLEEGLMKSGGNSLREDRPNLYYPIYFSESTKSLSTKHLKESVEILPISDGIERCWRWSKGKLDTADSNDLVVKKVKGQWKIYTKQRLSDGDEVRTSKPKTVWHYPSHATSVGTKELKTIFGGEASFENPKSPHFLSDVVSIFTDPGDLILDPFAGSGTTAHAIVILNKRLRNSGASVDSGDLLSKDRRFVLIEMEEEIEESVTSVRLDKVIKDDKPSKGKKVDDLGGSYSRWKVGPPVRLTDGSLNEECSYRSLAQIVAARHDLLLNKEIDNKTGLIASDENTSLFFLHGDTFKALDDDDLDKIILDSDGRQIIIYTNKSRVDDEYAQTRGVSIRIIPYDYPAEPAA